MTLSSHPFPSSISASLCKDLGQRKRDSYPSSSAGCIPADASATAIEESGTAYPSSSTIHLLRITCALTDEQVDRLLEVSQPPIGIANTLNQSAQKPRLAVGGGLTLSVAVATVCAAFVTLLLRS